LIKYLIVFTIDEYQPLFTPLYEDLNGSPTQSLTLEDNDHNYSGYCDYECIEQPPTESGEAAFDQSSVHEHPQATTTSTFANGRIIISFLIDFLIRPYHFRSSSDHNGSSFVDLYGPSNSEYFSLLHGQ
jgi:hypothetical protein